MRSIWILIGLFASVAANAAEEAAATTVTPAAAIAADPDYIPPSTAIFSGLEPAAPPPDGSAPSSGQQMSQSINEALNIAPKSTQSVNVTTGPKPLDVAPLSVPDSPDVP